MNATQENKETSRPRGTLYETTRTILLAGIGAISLAQDEINNFLDKLVERGEMADADARKLVREVMDRRESLEHERREQLKERRSVKAAANSPTRADIDALNERIAELTRQIDELRRTQE
jgi:polyhydroxyalkanoate synthesis regulator phasin